MYQLGNRYQATFVTDGLFNNELIAELKLKGLKVFALGLKEVVNAANMVYSKIVTKQIAHSHDPIITNQINSCVRQNIYDTWKLSRKNSLSDIDGAMATVLAIWGSDQDINSQPLIF